MWLRILGRIRQFYQCRAQQLIQPELLPKEESGHDLLALVNPLDGSIEYRPGLDAWFGLA
jgi:hypothetical protein